MQTKLWFLSFIFWAGYSPRAEAADWDREERLEQDYKTHIEPWFQQAPDEYLDVSPSEKTAVKLRYRVILHPQASANIVLVHGYNERIEKHMEMAYDFYQAGYNVFMYDQRGFGASTRINPVSKASYIDNFHTYADDLVQVQLALIEKRAPRLKTLVYSHSMGGLIAMLAAIKSPQSFAGIVSSAPMLQINSGAVPEWIAPTLASWARKIGWGGKYAITQGPEVVPSFEKTLTHSLSRFNRYKSFVMRPEIWATQNGGASYAWVDEAFQAQQHVKDPRVLSQINAPLLIFQAGKDSVVAPEGQTELCAKLKRCELVHLPDAKHEIYREKDATRTIFLSKIMQFFRSRLMVNPA